LPENPADLRNSLGPPSKLKVEYRKVNSFFADYTKNISKGGTFIKTKKPLPVGTQFPLQALGAPPRGAVRALGRVGVGTRRRRGAGMGIRFVYTPTPRSAPTSSRSSRR
jgi:type IV pilus assembly protein PilZ